MAYLRGNLEPANEIEEKKMFQRTRGYTIFEGELYKLGVTTPWLKCIPASQGIELLKEIHSGLCGSHRSQTTCFKSFQTWFLLAFGIKRCSTNRKNLSSLPDDGTEVKKTFGTFTTHSTNLAPAKMEN
jgi:hypothetical protein